MIFTTINSYMHQMSRRPVPIEELIREGNNNSVGFIKPKFLSKSERQKLSQLKNSKVNTSKPQPSNDKNKRKHVSEETEIPVDSASGHQKSTVSKKKKKKFTFDWDASDDTSAAYEPLVTLSRTNDKIDITDSHWTEKLREDMTPRDWRIFKEDYRINSKGGDIENPLRSWDEAQVPTKLLHLIQAKYEVPTPIQMATIPVALKQRDVVGVAETGSGKTIAFLLPLLSYILSIDPNYLSFEHSQNHNKPLGLILAPTRELALQISKEAESFARTLGLNIVTIIGGHKYEETINSVAEDVHIVVATPGRLVDSIERGIIGLSKCYYLVMDEADRMIDMGFEKSLQSIMSYLPSNEDLTNSTDSQIFKIQKRNSLMFTATISPPIEKLTKNYLDSPAFLFIGDANEVVDRIEQKFEFVSKPTDDLDSKRFSRLVAIIRSHIHSRSGHSIIIFANFKKVCELLSTSLQEQGFKNSVIHGSKSQENREKTINEFRSGKVNILIATDVAARGIDIPNVSLVVNYQMTTKIDEYIHRIGRTGRAGKRGESFTFVDDNDAGVFMDLKKLHTRNGLKCPEWLLKHEATQNRSIRD